MNNNGGTFPNSGIVVNTKNIPIWSQSTFLGNFVTKMCGCVIWTSWEILVCVRAGVIISNCLLRINLALSVLFSVSVSICKNDFAVMGVARLVLVFGVKRHLNLL